jgi:hypothetical protein
VVTFSTPIDGDAAVVFGTRSGRYDQRVVAVTFRFDQPEENRRGLQFLHYARLVGLKAGQTYYYAAKLDNHTSPEYAFNMPALSGPMKFVVFGDLGFVGGDGTISRIIHDEVRSSSRPPQSITSSNTRLLIVCRSQQRFCQQQCCTRATLRTIWATTKGWFVYASSCGARL